MKLLKKRLLIKLDPPVEQIGSIVVPDSCQTVTESGIIQTAAADSPYKPGQAVWFDRALFGCTLSKDLKIINHKDLLTVDGQPIDDVIMVNMDPIDEIRKIGSVWFCDINQTYRRDNLDETGHRTGTVTAIGPGVKTFSVGDRVAFPALQFVTRENKTFMHASDVMLKL